MYWVLANYYRLSFTTTTATTVTNYVVIYLISSSSRKLHDDTYGIRDISLNHYVPSLKLLCRAVRGGCERRDYF